MSESITSRHRSRVPLIIGLVMVGLAASCGGGDNDTESADTTTATSSGAAATAASGEPESSADSIEGVADEMVEDLEERQAAEGGGSAVLTVGDRSWSFDAVLCAFGEEEIRQEGAEFVLSALADGLQLYVSIDSFGHSVTLNDVENFSDPSVSLSDGYSLGVSDGPRDFIVVDGNSVRASGPFLDTTDESDFETTDGTLEATCP